MKLFKQATWADGDIVAPHELNTELRHQLGQLNGGLDLENFGDALAHGDMDPDDDPWMIYSDNGETSSQDVIISGAGREQVVKIPTSLGYQQITTAFQEGVINIYAMVCVNCTSTLQTYTLAAMVDGALVAETGCSTASETSSRMLVCSVPVSAGTHIIEGVLRFAEESVDVDVLTSNLLVTQLKV